MCGLSGFLDRSAATPAETLTAIARAMAETLRHRGPDDEGAWVDAEAGIAFGFRRLAIIDLSADGHQPMHSACGRYVIAFNGEVYNFRALRAELEPRGHRFRGHSDTEVMLAAISEWGLEDAVGRFVGMFAFALWDRQERTLYLVRDRLGIKPLYYGWAGNVLLFGSELKALRAHPAFRATIDRHALASYMRYDYVPAPCTIYQEVSKLPPGTILKLSVDDANSSRPEPVTYWSARGVARRAFSEPLVVSPAEATARLEELLRDAVRLRLESDVPLGAFLSGGIDSSTVVSLMQAESSKPVRTFTIGFRESDHDEAPRARAVAAHLGTQHTEFYVQPADALKLIPQIPEWYDEPFADSSQLPTYLVSRMTREHVTVSLSGDGGDELFAGYDRYSQAARMWAVARRLPGPLRRRIGELLRRISPGRIDRLVALLPRRFRFARAGDKSHKLFAALALDGVDAIYRRLLSHGADTDRLLVAPTGPEDGIVSDPTLAVDFPEFVPRAQLIDLMTYLPDDILTKLDRASMAVGLEARVPLLDHRVVEFAWRLPLFLKVREGVDKWILRQVLYRHVPRHLVDRPKMGFSVPLDAWLRGPLRDWAEDLLSEDRLRADGYFRPEEVRRKWSEHLSGSRSWRYLLWDVLMFQAWKVRWA
jgi:asparagine synthase (glutamine-hydrolysing)